MFVSFYGDAQTVSVEDTAYFFLDVLSFSRRSVSDGKSVKAVGCNQIICPATRSAS